MPGISAFYAIRPTLQLVRPTHGLNPSSSTDSVDSYNIRMQ